MDNKDAEQLKQIADKYSWYHTIELTDGLYTKSVIPHFKGKLGLQHGIYGEYGL